jgi:hypothetical protein
MGLAKGNEGKEKFSDEPVRVYGSGKTSKNTITKKDVNEFNDKEWESFVNGTGF